MIKEQRKKKGLTQLELAKKIGVDFSYLSKLENHPNSQKPSLDLILKLSDELDLDIGQLLTLFFGSNDKNYDTLVTCTFKKRTYNKLVRDAKLQDTSISNFVLNIVDEHYKK
ncbi:HTH-type transcriptional regulator SinR [Clostridium puniceum]|uniref:HTH-type transcriptional regulator SinR n=1 Tax=Clostridium puniceum TaxID=29367 RepID=A0A1S8T9K1_9CLOT|nr:helix-turn-helix transcriptional regulator [Clostridium puniceum]OOM74460.1 HTH-type transcriptional regulator SinR [Clostridium puniceum]